MKPSIPTNYAIRIKQLRKQHGLTQTELGERLGVSFASINRWENAQARPNALAWQKIERAEMLGLDGLADSEAHSLREAPAAYQTGPAVPPDLNFSAPPDLVLTLSEGCRLAYGHQFNPAFAAETAAINPLPHQRVEVDGKIPPDELARLNELLGEVDKGLKLE